MTKNTTIASDKSDIDPDARSVCGIVMPIASMGDEYPEEHWRRVRKILQRAIERTGMRSQLVWDNAEIDVIQSGILKNLYENDVVVCDLSGLNPNVMLETGLRLSTKRPTIIVTDRVVKPPFDVATMGYIEYQKDLEYNAIEDFIERLSKKISAVQDAQKNGKYSSFVEQFKFETVTPATVNVSAEEFIKDQLTSITASVRRLELRQRNEERSEGRRVSDMERRPERSVKISGNLSHEEAQKIEMAIDSNRNFGLCFVEREDDGKFAFTVPISPDCNLSVAAVTNILRRLIEEGERESLPF